MLKMLRFLSFKKYARKTFRILPYARKQNIFFEINLFFDFLLFFLNVRGNQIFLILDLYLTI